MRTTNIVWAIVYFIIMVLGFLLNGLVLVAVLKNRSTLLKKRFAILFSLALSDLLKVVPMMTLLVSVILGPSLQAGTTACLVSSTMSIILTAVTVAHLAAESVNRLVSIVWPFNYEKFLNSTFLRALLPVLWIVPILGVSIPPLLVFGINYGSFHSLRMSMYSCTLDVPRRETKSEIDKYVSYAISITVIYFAIPFAVMFISYSVIFRISLAHISQIRCIEKYMAKLATDRRNSISDEEASIGSPAPTIGSPAMTIGSSVSGEINARLDNQAKAGRNFGKYLSVYKTEGSIPLNRSIAKNMNDSTTTILKSDDIASMEVEVSEYITPDIGTKGKETGNSGDLVVTVCSESESPGPVHELVVASLQASGEEGSPGLDLSKFSDSECLVLNSINRQSNSLDGSGPQLEPEDRFLPPLKLPQALETENSSGQEDNLDSENQTGSVRSSLSRRNIPKTEAFNGDSGNADPGPYAFIKEFSVMSAWAEILRRKALEDEENHWSISYLHYLIKAELKAKRREIKLAKTLGSLLCAFLIFYLPVLVFAWKNITSDEHSTANLFNLGRFLVAWAFLNSVMNPIIYCLRIPELKKSVKKIIDRVKHRLRSICKKEQ